MGYLFHQLSRLHEEATRRSRKRLVKGREVVRKEGERGEERRR
jgi:hypothetical protein